LASCAFVLGDERKDGDRPDGGADGSMNRAAS